MRVSSMGIGKNELFENVFTLQNFLSEGECRKFIKEAESIGFDEAKVGFPEGDLMVKGIRNNDRVIYKDCKRANTIFQRAKPFLPSIIDGYEITRFNEMARFYKYTSGQRFKMHKDGSYKASEDEESKLTFLIYLNEDCEGGETKFKEHANIKPKIGMALIFPHSLWHEGSAVISGYKYVLRFDVLYKRREEA